MLQRRKFSCRERLWRNTSRVENRKISPRSRIRSNQQSAFSTQSKRNRLPQRTQRAQRKRADKLWELRVTLREQGICIGRQPKRNNEKILCRIIDHSGFTGTCTRPV